MAIDVMRHVYAGGYAAMDEVLEWADRNAKDAAGAPKPRTESFKNWADWWRVGSTALALGVQQFWPKYPKLMESVSTVGFAFTIKSASRAVRESSTTPAPAPAASRASWVPRRTAVPSGATQPVMAGVGSAVPGIPMAPRYI